MPEVMRFLRKQFTKSFFRWLLKQMSGCEGARFVVSYLKNTEKADFS